MEFQGQQVGGITSKRRGSYRKMATAALEKTVGQHSIDLALKGQNHHPIDIQREMLKEKPSVESYRNQIRLSVESGLKTFPDSDFYVVVLLKKEPLLTNVIRFFYITRRSCPSTCYDQTVYKYDHKNNKLDILWQIPNMASVNDLYANRKFLTSEYNELLDYIIKFRSGDLDRLSDRLNKSLRV